MSGQDGLVMPDISKELLEEIETEYGTRRFAQMQQEAKEVLSLLEYVREKAKDIKGFWAFTLMTHQLFSQLVSLKSDKEAFSYLTDVELVQDTKDPRPYTIKFHFSENPYFSDSVLEKKYELNKNVAAPSDGSVTKEMIEFSDDDLTPSSTKINWKSADVDLVAKHPRAKLDEDDEDSFEGDAGSFFHYFTESSDPYGIGATLLHDLLPDTLGYFTGRGENTPEGMYDDDELDEEDDDDEGSIDLEDEEEQPSRKKQKSK